MDFYDIKERSLKKDVIEIYPDFQVDDSHDLMIKGGAFYAVWDEQKGLWSTNEYDLRRLIDDDLMEYKRNRKSREDEIVKVRTLKNYSTKGWKELKNYIKDAPDNFHLLDCEIAWQNTEVEKKNYVSKRLPYMISPGKCDAWDELIGTLYDEEERQKIEWAIGAIMSGQAKRIQKFMVLYGEAGAGKSTILNVIQDLFDGYYTIFNAKALTSTSNAFSTAPFKNNPLVAIQHDGDLSRIEDNTLLNSIVSHEQIMINDKYERAYPAKINCFLFMATNKPVKITDAKSGIIRRLIDVKPSGRHLPPDRYFEVVDRTKYELGHIADHCLKVYDELGRNYFANYRPMDMMFKTDVFYNFVESNFDLFNDEDGITLKQAWETYKAYCDDALVEHKLPMYKFREELKSYFKRYDDVAYVNGQQKRKFYSGFLKKKFKNGEPEKKKVETNTWLDLKEQESRFDILAENYPAQYATKKDTPYKSWDKVKTILKDIDTRKMHYVRVPENHIILDFDIRDENGEKDLKKNIEAALPFPPTYAETSKSGNGLHLHYIYDGDPTELNPIFADGIEIKVFTGLSSLRRKLVLCNNMDFTHISSGLPLKGETKKVINDKMIEDEKHLRALIAKALRKEIPPGKTITCINFIFDILEEAYANPELSYDVSDTYDAILDFAMHSTNNKNYCCLKMLQMKFKSKDRDNDYLYRVVKPVKDLSPEAPIVIYDVEVFKNLFIICWKPLGGNVVKMINPKPTEVYELRKYRLVGFNNKNYDDIMCYARSIGYTNRELYDLSQRLITKKDKTAKLSSARNWSYTDIYDYSSKKQSLKRWEIDLGKHHQECPFKWDQEVPEEHWDEVADYCVNDVEATEAVWYETQPDFLARQILAYWANLYVPSTVYDSTNELTTRIIFRNNRKPHGSFNYRNLGEVPEEFYILDTHTMKLTKSRMSEDELIKRGIYNVFDLDMRPIFPGYRFDQYSAKKEKSTYRGETVGEGGYVFATFGIWLLVALLDIASMHPSSIIAERLFGEYTDRYSDIVNLRLHIKHGEFDIARQMFDGALSQFFDDEGQIKTLSQALKIAINSVYGLTSAKFPNPFRDDRNIDNIVAKRGELFMINLKHEVAERGFTVAHIKTDSIKIPNATPEIIEFVTAYGKMYGYNFEHEDDYDRMCLVNNAVYIAKYMEPHKDKNTGEEYWWTATGAQFQHPYVFKHLFTHQDLVFSDLCETKSVTTAMYLNMNESNTEEDRLIFVGKTGAFCPIREGKGGGILLRESGDGTKYDSVTGTKGYRWLESETVLNLEKEDDIDISYFNGLADAAKDAINQYGDFDWFASLEPSKPILDIADATPTF